MKIIYVITGLGLGGAEKVVTELADQMSERGHEVKIAYLKGQVVVFPANKNIELIYLGLETLKDTRKAYQRYKKLLDDFHADIVHAHMIHANIFTRIARNFFPIPKLICTAHNSNEGGQLRMLAYRYTNYLSDLNTNVSNEASESLIGKGAFTPKNLITVYNGVNLKRFNKSKNKNKNQEVKFLSVGRFNEQKDYPNLFRAIALLKNRINLNVKFYIAGDGELRNFFEDQLLELGIQELVVFLGKRADIPELLNDANFFILSSKHEGLPTVIIEAMACQTYVVATDCGGSAEIMGETGKLVPIQNSEALSAAILNVLSLDNSSVVANNLKARQRIENLFSLDISVNNWLALYDSK